MKSRISAMSRIVSEADRFKSLLKTFESNTEQQDIKTMTKALAEINASYDVLKDLPEFKNYKINIATFTERLESQIRPRLVSAFERHAAEEAVDCLIVFRQIGRMDEVHSLYYRSKITKVLKLWQDYDAVKAPLAPGQPLPPPAVALPKWLPTFYNELLLILNTEAPWLISVFNESSELISGLLLECLKVINETYEQRLTPLPLDQLIQAYLATKTFAENVKGYLSSSSASLQPQFESSAEISLSFCQVQVGTFRLRVRFSWLIGRCSRAMPQSNARLSVEKRHL